MYIFLNQGTATRSVRKRVGKKLRGAIIMLRDLLVNTWNPMCGNY